ncbi:MOSC domain-containing protein [Micromonospora zamorensis]|uniref:MOSC domain-containing protein n=1 Tax=Micromonospora zamorensis TaxID=709883 RepID=UPI0033F522CE
MSRIVSVNLAVPEPNPAKDVGVTGINKQPVDHLVAVRAPGPKTTGLHSGLLGDQIFNVEHHGGDDQAVYAYAREDYDWWQARLSRRRAGAPCRGFAPGLTLPDASSAVTFGWRQGRRRWRCWSSWGCYPKGVGGPVKAWSRGVRRWRGPAARSTTSRTWSGLAA